MLNTIRPDFIHLDEKGLVADLGPVTLLVETTDRDSQQIIRKDRPLIYTHLEKDDTNFYLLGFSSEERRKLYQVLNKISGIGRRSALTVLECGECRDTLRAVASNDNDYFAQVPGVGKSRITAIISRLSRTYKDALPVASNISIRDWVVIRDALMQMVSDNNQCPNIDKLDLLILEYQKENNFESAEAAFNDLQAKI
jgi:Holliday junction resolvasome RuvABC DNA-binding subunit